MLKIRRNFADIKIKDRSGLLAECERLISESDELDPLIKQIKNLKRGQVTPESTIERSKIASYFTSEIQQIFNHIYNYDLTVNKLITEKLGKLVSKADAILRENIVLQSVAPLDVIKFKNVPVRYSHSTFGGKEQRWGYGLHNLPTTELGYSICLAFMPPKYIQSYHNHTISEYCLAIDKPLTGIVNPGKDEKKNLVKVNEISHFSATTPHTLYNHSDSFSRNVTAKLPIGLLDWRPIYNLNKIEDTHSDVLKGNLSQLDRNKGTKISFRIKDKFYNYELKLMQLKKDTVIENIHEEDSYILVIDGELMISSADIKKHCCKNDFIVIDKNTEFKIKTKNKCRLYSVDFK